MRPSDTVTVLKRSGFSDIEVTDTGKKYLHGYQRAIELAEKGEAPIFGVHILLGKLAPQILRNAARNIEEGRTQPVQIICRKTASAASVRVPDIKAKTIPRPVPNDRFGEAAPQQQTGPERPFRADCGPPRSQTHTCQTRPTVARKQDMESDAIPVSMLPVM